MTEQKHVNPLITQNVKFTDWMRVENRVGTGQPDLNGCRLGVEVWVECKVFDGNILHFEKSEIAWITKRGLHRGNVWIVARKANRSIDSLFVYHCSALGNLIEAGMIDIEGVRRGPAVIDPEAKVNLATAVFPSPFNWINFTKVIFKL